MKTSLENVSYRFYAFMDTRDLRVQREYRDAAGNIVIDATVPEFRMRFVKKDGSFKLLVGAKSDSQYQDLNHVLQQLANAPVPNDPEILTDYLLNRYDDLCAVLQNAHHIDVN